MFISFEGLDGSGKSTQAKKLAFTLTALGFDVVHTREPGGSPLAEELRSLVVTGAADRMDAQTELLIFTAARRDHVARIIKPALEAGKIVICDRYLGSTHALQGAAGVHAEIIDTLHELFVGLMPDLTLFLDLSAEESLRRSIERLGSAADAEARFESKGQAFHDTVGQIMRAQCAARPEWQAVEAAGTVDEVGSRILAIVTNHPLLPA